MAFELVFIALSALITCGFLALSKKAHRKLPSIELKNTQSCPKVSVIIPAHNKEKLIKACIESVKNSLYPNKEIIVVDDCSTDNTRKILKKINRIKSFSNKKRLGKSASLNNAAKKVSGRLILFLDADTILQKDTIETLVSTYAGYERIEGRGKVGFIAPKYKLVNSRSLIAKLAYLEQSIHQFLIKVQMNLESILAIRGCCLLVNKKAFFAVKGFSNTILEDGDFSAKLV